MMDMEEGAGPTDLPANALLAIQLEGHGIELGTVSAGTVCRYVDAFRLGLQATIEIVEAVQPVQVTGRRKRWIERMADLPLVGMESSGVRILLGTPRQDGLFAAAEHEAFGRAFELLFQSIALAAEGDAFFVNENFGLLPRWAELRLLGIVGRLMPPKRGPLKRISFLRRTPEDEQRLLRITLDRQCRQLIETAIEHQQANHVSFARVAVTQSAVRELW